MPTPPPLVTSPRRGWLRFAPIPLAPECFPSCVGADLCVRPDTSSSQGLLTGRHIGWPLQSPLQPPSIPKTWVATEPRPCRPAPVPPVGGGLCPAPPGKAAFCTDPVGSGMFPFLRRGGPVCPPGYVILPGPAHGPTHRLAPTESLAAAIDPENLGGDRAPPLPSGSGPPCRGRALPRPAGEAPGAEIPTLFNSFILNLQIV